MAGYPFPKITIGLVLGDMLRGILATRFVALVLQVPMRTVCSSRHQIEITTITASETARLLINGLSGWWFSGVKEVSLKWSHHRISSTA